MKETKSKVSILLFLIITFGLSSICYYIRIKGGDAAAGMISILMWCPAIAAFIVRGIYYRKQKILGWNSCEMKYILYSLFIPAIYLGLSYGAYWLVNQKSFTGQIYSDSIVIILLLIPSSLLTAAGEEIGWRGFLLPRMTEIWNMKIAVLLSGLIWAAWHFPPMIAGIYQSGTVIWYQLPMFTVEIIAMTSMMAYLRMRSKSVWPPIILHASHNYLDQAICGPLTNAAKQSYFIGETGIITAIIMIITAFIIISRLNIKYDNA